MLQNLNRKIEFARHIPVSKLVRRMELSLRRRIRDKFSPNFSRSLEAHRSDKVLEPIFSPRTDLAPKFVSAEEIELTFLNRAMRLNLSELDWNSPGPGAENQLLRMNLHYMEYLEGADDKIWEQLVADWIAKNGSGSAGAWRDSWNSYALSIRVVVWMQELARRKERISFDIVESAERSILNQVAFLEKNLETDIGGNHLIKNIKALLWAGAYFEGADANRWRRKGLSLLRQELDVQILADGMHYERSPSYHCQVFSDLLECLNVLCVASISSLLSQNLEKMAQVIADLTHPDGFVAQFNDAGLNMAYSPSECLRVYEGSGLQPVLPSSMFRLDEAGYFGGRINDQYLVLDCGPIAPDDLPAHGHGDVLSFEWSVGGQRLIVDPGVFEYIASERRMASRSAASHNTLCIEGADQADFFGAFRCGRRPNAEVLDISLKDHNLTFVGQHDGFANLKGGPIHQRTFEFNETSLSIVDSIHGQSNRRAEIRYLLHPKIRTQIKGDGVLLSSGKLNVFVSSSAPISIDEAVWCPDLGVEIPSSCLKIHMFPVRESISTLFHLR